MKRIDLHTHSTASDGSMGPSELVRHAGAAGLAAIALTDHDTLDGIEEAMEEGKRCGVEVIAGVEISVDFTPEMHMLAYFPNGGHREMLPVLTELKRKRDERNPKIIAKLGDMGIHITLEEAAELAGGNIVGRPHIAEAMVRKGYVESVRDAFDLYLASGKPAYFKKDKFSPAEAIRTILGNGGVPVLAHPVHLEKTWDELDPLLRELTAQGLKGAEAIYADNTEEQTLRLMELCERCDILATGGSDFHGRFKPEIELGTGKGNLQIPYTIVEELKRISRR